MACRQKSFLLLLFLVSSQPQPDILWRFNNYDINDRKTYAENHTMFEKTNAGLLKKQAEIVIDESVSSYCAHIPKGKKEKQRLPFSKE